jgi:hypothetical protein
MWVLVLVAMLEGQVYLDARPQADKAACLAKAKEMLVEANKAEIPFAVACKEIKLV